MKRNEGMNNMELSVFVGSKIKEYRKKRNMTQKELGEIIGVKHNTISDYERGRTEPEQDSLFAIAKTLKVSVDDFFPVLDNTNSLKNILDDSNDKLDVSDMAFLKQLINQVETLDGSERKELMDNIRFAIDFFNKRNK